MNVSPSLAQSDAVPSLDAGASLTMSRKTSRDGEPWLHNEVARRMAQRLPLIRQPVRHWLQWQPRSGGLASQALLEKTYPQAECTVLQSEAQDMAWAMQALQTPWWRRWLGSKRHFAQQTTQAADMVWSNMGLHMQARPAQWMQQWAQALNAQGFVMFSCLGPDSLRELRELYAAVGWPAPSHAFTDMHDWGDMLLKSGFASPIMDMERITLTYDTPQALLQELRSLGRNLNLDRFQGCRGRAWLQVLHAQLQQHLSSPAHGGRLALTFEVIYGHAFKAPPRASVKSETQLSLDDMRAQLKKDRLL